ncbi:hypothetical protein ZIOFF_004502 [Zingiber officinale]|uniref:CRM domain-containing protein n=1 Tax=Zingiber officinale TaxID=94328 RepID=A0A8J5LR20_ZINOF|nr:hypothetical protein ZIOFF_004502 [Zingiber officinale]
MTLGLPAMEFGDPDENFDDERGKSRMHLVIEKLNAAEDEKHSDSYLSDDSFGNSVDAIPPMANHIMCIPWGMQSKLAPWAHGAKYGEKRVLWMIRASCPTVAVSFGDERFRSQQADLDSKVTEKSNTELAERTLPEPELQRLRNVALRMKERMTVRPAECFQTDSATNANLSKGFSSTAYWISWGHVSKIGRTSLRDREMTILRRLARTMPPHFALGGNRQHQGLATAIVKLWEKSSIAKIAIERCIPNTSKGRIAEEIKVEKDDEEVARLRVSASVADAKSDKGSLVAATPDVIFFSDIRSIKGQEGRESFV